MRSIALAFALGVGSLVLAPACDRTPPVPAASDPTGKDLVVGAVVAAAESSGGVRLYKIVAVNVLPEPFGTDLHMIVYDPKVKTFQEAAELRKKGGTKVLLDHILVRLVHFLPRDHRVIAQEAVTDDEMAPYLRATQSTR